MDIPDNSHVSSGPSVDLSLLSRDELESLIKMRQIFEHEKFPDQSIPNSWFQLDDWTFLRYLRARSFNVQKAEQMLKATLEFRRVYKPHLLNEHDPELRALLNERVWRLIGSSISGSPIQISFSGLINVGVLGANEEIYRKYVILCNELIGREYVKNAWRSDKNMYVSFVCR